MHNRIQTDKQTQLSARMARLGRRGGLLAACACVCYFAVLAICRVLLLTAPTAGTAYIWWRIDSLWVGFGLVGYGLVAWTGFFMACVCSCIDVLGGWPQVGIERAFWPLVALLSLAAAPLVALTGWLPM